LISGGSLREIAAAHGLQPNAILRHRQNHLAAELRAGATIVPVQPVATPARALQLEASPPSPPALPSTVAPDAGSVGDELLLPAPGAPLDPYALACELRDSAVSILRRASASGDGKLALDANRAAVNVLDRLARLMPATGNAAAPLHQSEEWHRTRAAIINALQPFPEARVAVAAALAELEPLP
jgi:hypothetical protein